MINNRNEQHKSSLSFGRERAMRKDRLRLFGSRCYEKCLK